MKACKINACSTKVYGWGWCIKHYTRWKRTGDPLGTRYAKSFADIIEKRTELIGGCLEWTGHRDKAGYGNLGWKGKSYKAHVFFYEQYVGKVAEGLQLDHLCHNTSCVGVQHLRAVTPQINAENKLSKGRNKLGVVGVYPTRSGTYQASLGYKGKNIYIGCYATVAQASAARASLKSTLYTPAPTISPILIKPCAS